MTSSVHVLTDPRADAIVRAVVDLAHWPNVTTVAEGVENADIAAWLRDCGCEVAQGIYYSPPDHGCGDDGFDRIAGSARLTPTAGFEHALSGGFRSDGGVRPVSVDGCAVGRFIRSVAQYFSVDNSRGREQQAGSPLLAKAQLSGRRHVGNARRSAWMSRRIASRFASFQTLEVRGIDHRSSGRIIEGAPAPLPHRCGAHRGVLGVRRRVVARQVGRPVGDDGFADRGRSGISGFCGRECRYCRAARAWQAAAGMAGDDFRPGRAGVRRDDSAVLPTILPRHCPTSVPAVSDHRVFALPYSRLPCIADIPVRISGRRPFRMLLDGAIVGASLFVVAWVTLLRDAYSTTGVSRLDEFLSIACPIAGVVTVTVAILGLARANAPGARR